MVTRRVCDDIVVSEYWVSRERGSVEWGVFGNGGMVVRSRSSEEIGDRSSGRTMVEYVYLDRRYCFVTSGSRLVMMVG